VGTADRRIGSFGGRRGQFTAEGKDASLLAESPDVEAPHVAIGPVHTDSLGTT